MKTHEDVKKVLFDKETIAARVREVASDISRDYAGKNPLVVCILKGAVVFFSDLIREISVEMELDFMAISSYGTNTRSSGQVRLLKDLTTDPAGRHVIIVEDIVDSGNTLFALADLLKARGAASVRICCLLNKPARRVADVKPDYVCFDIADEFVIGYGLDYAEKFRNLDCVCVIKEEAI